MGQFARHGFSAGWSPSFDAFNCPKDALLRADNLVLDELGALALRQGSQKINGTALSDTDVHSLNSPTLNGAKVRVSGAGDHIYLDGVATAATFAGSGDIATGSHRGQLLHARGTTKKKHDGTTERNWGIAAPSSAPTLTALAPDSKTLASCDSSELPIMTSNEGTQAFVADRFSAAASAVEIQPNATTGRGVSTKTFTAPTDFTVYNSGTAGTDDDPLDAFLYVTEPQFVSAIGIMVDVDEGTFQNNWYDYWFTPFTITELIATPESSLASNYSIEGYDREELLSRIENRSENGQLSVGVSPATNSWSHLSIPRGMMQRHGLTSGKNWSTVRAVRVVVIGIAGGSGAAVRFDNIRLSGAGLTGKYAARIVAAYDNGTYVALSGPSAISNEMEVSAQGLAVTIDAATIAALDTQVTALWVYLMGGRLNAFYRAATGSVTTTNEPFDYTSPFEVESIFTSIWGLANHTSAFEVEYGGTIGPSTHNYGWEVEYLSATDPVTISITTSELTMMAANLRLETDTTVPPDTIIMIEGPHFDRTLCLTATTINPSRRLNPDSYGTGEVVTIGDASETGLWLKKLGERGLYCGTTRDIYRLEGDWTPQPDGSINVTKVPMHVSEPPISSAVEVGAVNGVERLIYLSGDGWHILAGGPLVNNQVDLLWRGYTRHGVSYVNIAEPTARFRCAVSKNVLFCLTPEGTSTTSTSTIHAYHFGKQRWSRHTYPQAFRSIIAEPDGTLIAGDSAGFVRILDLATKQDDGVDIPVVLWTPADDNSEPFTYKDAENLWMRLDTGENTATINFHLNGNSVADSSTTTAQGTADTANLNVSAISQFSQLQMRITGSFDTFVMRGWGLRYLNNPAPQVIHDTNQVSLSDDILQWVSRIRIKAASPVDMTVATYWDGTAGTSTSVTSLIGRPYVYEVSMGREDKGRVGRVVITTSSPSHVYWIGFVFRGSGREIEKRVQLMPEAA